VNGDGYTDTGWHVEIDPATRTVRQYGNGKSEKLWALGRMSHENIVLASDRKTAYFGEDSPDGAVYKFVANTTDNLSAGTLYVLKLSAALSSGEPTTTTGSWVQVPNTTKSDRNNTYSLATNLGATQFNGVEDLEIASNGQVYFTSKGNGRVYRFTDNGSGLSSFQTFVGGQSYAINYGSGSVSEDWGIGNDNLAFDGDGNLWVLQDGGRGHIWVVRPSHTQTSPRVELFATTPSGAESTGITFSPDKKFMFLSIQHPSSTNSSQTDASGTSVSFNAAATIVIARKENLGDGSLREEAMDYSSEEANNNVVAVFPSLFENEVKVRFSLHESAIVNISMLDMTGRVVKALSTQNIEKGDKEVVLDLSDVSQADKAFVVTVDVNGKKYSSKVFRK
jgi:secreted PhoX family phosphatase